MIPFRRNDKEQDVFGFLGIEGVSSITGQSVMQETAAAQNLQVTPGFSETFDAAYNESTTAADAIGRYFAKDELSQMSEANQERKVDAEDLNTMFGHLEKKFTESQYLSVAQHIADEAKEKIALRGVTSRGNWAASFLGGMSAHMMDPIEMGVGMLTGSILPRLAGSLVTANNARLAAIGGFASRNVLATEIIGDMIGNAAVEPLLAYSAGDYNEEYTAEEFAMSVVAAPLAMGALMKGVPFAARKLGSYAAMKLHTKNIGFANAGKSLDVDAELKLEMPKTEVATKDPNKVYITDASTKTSESPHVKANGYMDADEAIAISKHGLQGESTKVKQVDVTGLNMKEVTEADFKDMDVAVLKEQGFDGIRVTDTSGRVNTQLLDTGATKKAIKEAGFITEKNSLETDRIKSTEQMSNSSNDIFHDEAVMKEVQDTPSTEAPDYKETLPPELVTREVEGMDRMDALVGEGKAESTKLQDFKDELQQDLKDAESWDKVLRAATECMG